MTDKNSNENGCFEWLKLGAIVILGLVGLIIFSNVFDFVQGVISALIGPVVILFIIGSIIMYLVEGDE